VVRRFRILLIIYIFVHICIRIYIFMLMMMLLMCKRGFLNAMIVVLVIICWRGYISCWRGYMLLTLKYNSIHRAAIHHNNKNYIYPASGPFIMIHMHSYIRPQCWLLQLFISIIDISHGLYDVIILYSGYYIGLDAY
jgi:hypothetical protein